jgi:hypothetical protein
MSAYPTHLLGDIAMLDLDSILDGYVSETSDKSTQVTGTTACGSAGASDRRNTGFEIG